MITIDNKEGQIMGREISLFSDYRQKENSLTNYCGLILKLLYTENPISFEEAITSMISGEVNLVIGPTFSQQQKQTTSIPDLAITQKSFSILFETKLTDWFYSDQIKKHISGLGSDNGIKILFLISNFDTEEYEDRFSKEIDLAKEAKIILQPISFEFFLEKLMSVRSSDSFKQHLDEFESYLDSNGRLPKWKYLLEVVNCRGSLSEVATGAYLCPNTGGSYKHRRAKYFGPYAHKKVSRVYEIDAVVAVDVKMSNAHVKWKNKDSSNTGLCETAINNIKTIPGRSQENESVPLLVFILSNGADTNFKKMSSGGMFQSKKYFHGIASDCSNSKDLAEKLKVRTWE